MKDVEKKSDYYEFAGVRFLPADGVIEVIRTDRKLELTKTQRKFLLALVEEAGDVVTYEELRERVWPHYPKISELKISESPLHHTIQETKRKLIKSLKDNGVKNDFIAALSGTGYRLSPAAAQTLRPRVVAVAGTGDRLSAQVEGIKTETRKAGHDIDPNGTKQPSPAIKSIAVLPFKTLNAGRGDKDQGMGMADALITRLSNTGQLVVRQTSAVLKYANSQDPLAAGRELKVDAVLNGSIQREGDDICVRVRLVRVSDEKPLWADSIKKKFTNIIAVQETVSKRVAKKLMLKLSGEEKERLVRRYTESVEANRAYVMGRSCWSERTVKGFLKGAIHFQQAIEIDPNYALAYTGLADSYTLLGVYVTLPPRVAFPMAKIAAEKALEIDDTLADAHFALGAIRLFYDWNWQGADQEFNRTVELNPNHPYVHQWNGLRLVALGRFDEASSELERAKELEPPSRIINTNVGWVHYFAGRYDQALEEHRQTVQMDPNYARVHIRLGMAYEQLEKRREAIAEYQEAIRLAGKEPYVMALLGYTYATAKQRDKARKILAELDELQQQRYVPPYSFALIHAGLGEIDESFKQLEEAFEDRSYAMLYLKVEPMLDGLRSDPRMSDLVRRMGLVS